MSVILVVEDERELNKVLQAYLTRAGYRALSAYSGPEALRLWEQEKPDLVILDLNLPGIDGLELAREMRKTRDVPIIMATARVDEVDRLIGLELGADDYVTKPYSPREVVARVKAVLRRGARAPEAPAVLTLGKLSIDTGAHSAKLGSAPLELTPTEFGMLQLLVSQPGRVFTRLQLLEAAQGMSFEGYERSVDVHIKNLRRKIKEADPEQQYIETVFGVGYRARQIEG
ncbi:MAG: response regulator transcription factor [Chloroflexi bacterium]|jgi:DNA-binding response OmpR family regulator|nr:response regulator transcription factor [Anaerolineaceae bacterium]NLI44782.1 response regulator transcription factor [Chloroflexota bacterium]HOE35236.1 response regulator transcription factor [Anaerolineaceae bacterium]HOT25568.1 response regulator transcription factor [Anaerolineaceae bacterium]HQK03460.1 response regulator transcription factor [Anaerolineaceae bacterium]